MESKSISHGLRLFGPFDLFWWDSIVIFLGLNWYLMDWDHYLDHEINWCDLMVILWIFDGILMYVQWISHGYLVEINGIYSHKPSFVSSLIWHIWPMGNPQQQGNQLRKEILWICLVSHEAHPTYKWIYPLVI